MPYRIIILNGERRGERLDLASGPLLIGRDSRCRFQLDDPDVAPLHAEVGMRGDALFAKALSADNPILVNGNSSGESILQHGDVLQIGTTRLFVQSYSGVSPWDPLASIRKMRRWMTVVLPILILVALALVVPRCRRLFENRPQPPRPTTTVTNTMSAALAFPDDAQVTNIPRIEINSAVILTSHPPDVVDALVVMAEPPPISLDENIRAASQELAQASAFLRAAEEQEFQRQTEIISQSADAGLKTAESQMAPPPTNGAPVVPAPDTPATNTTHQGIEPKIGP